MQNGNVPKRKPINIKLIEIVEVIDGLDVFKICVLGFPDCGDEHPCPVHNTWGEIRDKTFQMLNDETLEHFKETTIKKYVAYNYLLP